MAEAMGNPTESVRSTEENDLVDFRTSSIIKKSRFKLISLYKDRPALWDTGIDTHKKTAK